MKRPIQILLQTTIQGVEDDWHIGRFSMLTEQLNTLKDSKGEPLCRVTGRNRDAGENEDDEVLSRLDTTEFDELWLFALDTGQGLSPGDCQGIMPKRNPGLELANAFSVKWRSLRSAQALAPLPTCKLTHLNCDI